MPKYMKPDTALARLVEDEAAPVMARCKALRQLDHPPLTLLQRIPVDTAKRTTPVPSRLRAIAALKYAPGSTGKKDQGKQERTETEAREWGECAGDLTNMANLRRLAAKMKADAARAAELAAKRRAGLPLADEETRTKARIGRQIVAA